MIRAVFAAALLGISPLGAVEVELEYAPSPVGNPLKGLVPYMGDHGDKFPHSMEFFYLPLSDLVVGVSEYDWEPLEERLREISGRGHSSVFRIFLEYPEKESGVPVHLRGEALNGNGFPDYGNERLQRCLADFLKEFGAKYDGDPRVGFITAGLLGKWGEWHTWPEDGRWAGKGMQSIVLDGYEAGFKSTPVLLRYPRIEDGKNVGNGGRRFGYHDDSFAWGTLDTGKKDDFWFYMTALGQVGDAALNKWKSQPIGGEIRPEAWGQCFDPEPENQKVQNFDACVNATHVSWLMDSGMFSDEHRTPKRVESAKGAVRNMGYEYHVPKAGWGREGDLVNAWIVIENRGVAPFYADWKISWALGGEDGRLAKVWPGESAVSGILPGTEKRFEFSIPAAEVPEGDHGVLISVPSPMPGGAPLRFANKQQDAGVPGWLTLGRVSL